MSIDPGQAERSAGAQRRGRGGRPPSDQAGEIDARLLDAASHLFLTQGFDGTSCDQVAARARAGKASIYARYANKDMLFAAVVRREVERSLTAGHDIPPDLPLRARLVAVGTNLIEHALQPDAIAFMRLIIAQATHFPDLASEVDAIGRDGGVRRVAEVIAARQGHEDAIGRAMPAAVAFIDLVFVPHLMRALLGDDPATLRSTASHQVDSKLTILFATDLLNAWN